MPKQNPAFEKSLALLNLYFRDIAQLRSIDHLPLDQSHTSLLFQGVQRNAELIDQWMADQGLAVDFLSDRDFHRTFSHTRKLFHHGTSPLILRDLQQIATEFQTLIFIRTTNPGSAPLFAERRAYGKPLYVKSKSSEGTFTRGQICLLGNLSKANKNSLACEKAQDSILETLRLHHFESAERFNHRSLYCLPKTLNDHDLLRLNLSLSKPVQTHKDYIITKAEHHYQLEIQIPTTGTTSEELGSLNRSQFLGLLEKIEKAGFGAFLGDYKETNRVPVHIVAELLNQGEDFWPYPLAADYDLFAVCPFQPWNRHKESITVAGETVELTSTDFLPRYHPTQGALSKFEDIVAQEINHRLNIKIARHGCEVNNCQYTSKLEPLIAICPGQFQQYNSCIVNWTDYLRLGLSAIANDYIFPVNFSWGSAAISYIVKQTGPFARGSMRSFICEYTKFVLGSYQLLQQHRPDQSYTFIPIMETAIARLSSGQSAPKPYKTPLREFSQFAHDLKAFSVTAPPAPETFDPKAIPDLQAKLIAASAVRVPVEKRLLPPLSSATANLTAPINKNAVRLPPPSLIATTKIRDDRLAPLDNSAPSRPGLPSPFNTRSNSVVGGARSLLQQKRSASQKPGPNRQIG